MSDELLLAAGEEVTSLLQTREMTQRKKKIIQRFFFFQKVKIPKIPFLCPQNECSRSISVHIVRGTRASIRIIRQIIMGVGLVAGRVLAVIVWGSRRGLKSTGGGCKKYFVGPQRPDNRGGTR